MCSAVILRRPGSDWPLLLGANRDELATRPSAPPGRHWSDRPEVVAGLDREAGGSWLGLNDWGVLAVILNRAGTLGPATGKRSRGELVLDALDHADAAQSARALGHLDPQAYRPFNLIVADNQDAFWLRHAGEGPVRVTPLPAGLTMVTALELNDPACARIARYRPLFASSSSLPDPEADDWSGWQLLLSSQASATGQPRDAMCIVTESAYGTLSSSLIALPANPARAPIWHEAHGRPGDAPYAPVALRAAD